VSGVSRQCVSIKVPSLEEDEHGLDVCREAFVPLCLPFIFDFAPISSNARNTK
jgi:hypothetical protein